MTALERTLTLLFYGLCCAFRIDPAHLHNGEPPRRGEPDRPLPYV